MTPEELKQRVDEAISMASDPEGAHSYEDDLRIDVIRKFCPSWVKDEINRLAEADFPRWCA